MKEIELSQNKIAQVDDSDFEWLSQWRWQAAKIRHVYYATRNLPMAEGRSLVYMHRSILGLTHERVQVDHADHDGLNNQRANLRRADHQKNQRNARKQLGCSSEYKGVYWDRSCGKWRARIRTDAGDKHLGRFLNQEDARVAYELAAKTYFKEFAYCELDQKG